jgi:NitT/TauT family transport system ATP-binding protein
MAIDSRAAAHGMTPSRAPRVLVEGVGKRFAGPGGRDGTLALHTVDMALRDGEFVSIVGPSGCGKSTLFNIIAGLIPPSSGRVLIDGRDVTGQTGLVGYMLQKDLLLPWKSVLENVTLGLEMLGEPRVSARERGRILLRRYGLGEFERHYPHALSGGMRQRVALMRTLLYARDVLLLDEPFGALDAQTRFLMQQWLLDVWHENRRTVLFITHDVDEAIFLSDRVYVMTSRPGALKEEVLIGLPRPRSLAMLTIPAFTTLKARLFALMHDESLRTLAQEGAALIPPEGASQ